MPAYAKQIRTASSACFLASTRIRAGKALGAPVSAVSLNPPCDAPLRVAFFCECISFQTRSETATRTMRRRRHIVFLEDLQRHSEREACLGAAQYAAEQPNWNFDPWPVTPTQTKSPSPEDLKLVDGILTTEPAMQRVYGIRHQTQIPRVYVLADTLHPKVPCVSLDEVAIGRMAAEHLLTRGYGQFAFIGSASFGWSLQRWRGFNSGINQTGKVVWRYLLPQEARPVFWSWNMTRRSYDLDKILAQLPKLCGIFAANDVIGCFVLQAAREKGFRVPEDIGVVAVDDDPVPNAAAGLAISSIHAPFREVGWHAARLLDEALLGRSSPTHVYLPPVRVVVRASTDVFMTKDPLVRKAQPYIEARRQERVSVSEVTRSLSTNRVTLGKRFNRHLDVGLLEYILKRRIEYAKELLQAGQLNVDEVAESCGFSSSSYFSRAFKKVTGFSPGRLRRSATGQLEMANGPPKFSN